MQTGLDYSKTTEMNKLGICSKTAEKSSDICSESEQYNQNKIKSLKNDQNRLKVVQINCSELKSGKPTANLS